MNGAIDLHCHGGPPADEEAAKGQGEDWSLMTASNSATKYSSGTVQAPSVTKKFAAISPRARGDRPRIFSSGAAGLWFSAAIFCLKRTPM